MRPRVFITQSRRTVARPCPVCQTRLDAIAGVTLDREPRGGGPPADMAIDDLTACLTCGTVLRLTVFGLTPASDAEVAELPAVLRDALLAGAEVARWRRARPQ